MCIIHMICEKRIHIFDEERLGGAIQEKFMKKLPKWNYKSLISDIKVYFKEFLTNEMIKSEIKKVEKMLLQINMGSLYYMTNKAALYKTSTQLFLSLLKISKPTKLLRICDKVCTNIKNQMKSK